MGLLLLSVSQSISASDWVKQLENQMIRVAAGSFRMGSEELSDEQPIHRVYLDSFFISKYEVTVLSYVAFLNESGCQYRAAEQPDAFIRKHQGRYSPVPGFENHPVTYVSWFDAKAFCQWISKKSGNVYDLPTEAQWEKAARGGNRSRGYRFSGSNAPVLVAWFDRNCEDSAQPVGLKNPNELGIHDMSGNVWEWCGDWYQRDYYSRSPVQNPSGPDIGCHRVHRGGSWVFDAGQLRSAFRNYYKPVDSYHNLGFRIVRND